MGRFLQLHTLTSYSATLLNRDDVGAMKRLPFGGAVRARVSSQCLKRHWRTAEDENALTGIEMNGNPVPMAIRSRRIFEKEIYEPLCEEGCDPDLTRAACEALLAQLLPEGKQKQAKKGKGTPADEAESASVARTEQVIVLGRPEVEFLRSEARELVRGAANPKAVAEATEARFKKDAKKNIDALRLGAGLDAAMFGRMTTGNVLSRCDAAIHVAHAFTVHRGDFETDYFSALDDLQGPEETGSGHINNSELASGLFYGYVVLDLPLLVSNLEGCERAAWRAADRVLAAEVTRRLVHLIATVSPGAKLGSTAPYAHAHLVLAECGNTQPRALANAFLDPVRATEKRPLLEATYDALAGHLAEMDGMYGLSGERRLAALSPTAALLAATNVSGDLPSLALWAADCVRAA